VSSVNPHAVGPSKKRAMTATPKKPRKPEALTEEQVRKMRGCIGFDFPVEAIHDLFATLGAARARIAVLEESLAATQEALREAVADARRNAEERDALEALAHREMTHAQEASHDYFALRDECEAWRAYQDSAHLTLTKRYPLLRSANDLRNQNEAACKSI
jgi:hypothetical protein